MTQSRYQKRINTKKKKGCLAKRILNNDYCYCPPSHVHFFPLSTPRHCAMAALTWRHASHGHLRMSQYPGHSALWQRRHCRTLCLRIPSAITRCGFVGRCTRFVSSFSPLSTKVTHTSGFRTRKKLTNLIGASLVMSGSPSRGWLANPCSYAPADCPQGFAPL